MKKYTVIFLLVALTLLFCGCNSDKNTSDVDYATIDGNDPSYFTSESADGGSEDDSASSGLNFGDNVFYDD